MKIAAIIVLIVLTAGYLVFNYTPIEKLIPEQAIPKTTGMTENQAIENVKKLPEVQDYLKRVPNGRVEMDNESEGQYNIHVYELKDGHSATFNWYHVSIKSGEVRQEFEIEPEINKESKGEKGTVTGKLCYPSEAIPEGTIEAKRQSDQKIFILNYGGSLAGGGNKYEFALEDGDYYLRFKTKADQMGYSTTVCPTGSEETCGDTKLRILRKAEVKAGQEVSGYNLCDFYYNSSNAPKF